MDEKQRIMLGTSGWNYEEWVGPFYVRRERKFTEYARVFNTTEINSTFYRYPTPGTIRGLIRASPRGFIFSAKMPKLITHKKKLSLTEGVKDDLDKFLGIMEPLLEVGKLGAILIQLPPSMTYNDHVERLEDFLGILPDNFRFAVEFRNLSWLRSETWKLLRSYNVAYTIVDEPLLPPKMVYTADFAYIRWHGRGSRPWFNYRYSELELREWVPRVREAAEKTGRVYGYFNNHFHGYAPENCIQLLEMLGEATRLQRKVKEKIRSYIAGKEEEPSVEELPETMDEALKLGLTKLLRFFTDKGRIDRAETIRESHISFKRKTRKLIIAEVKDYTIRIDLTDRVIEHNCDDWKKIFPEKKICKHIVRVFLSLPLEESKRILADMVINKEEWRFKTPET